MLSSTVGGASGNEPVGYQKTAILTPFKAKSKTTMKFKARVPKVRPSSQMRLASTFHFVPTLVPIVLHAGV